jgi:glutamine amidotransferase
MNSRPSVVVFDYGSGNVRSAQRALEHVGAEVTLTSDFETALNADGLFVPGVGAFDACMQGINKFKGGELVDRRLAGGRAVFGVCVGMQILFDQGVEHGIETSGLGQWPGVVEKLTADVLPHMGWNTVSVAPDSKLFAGVEAERFYFVHSYGVTKWLLPDEFEKTKAAQVTWCEYGEKFVAAVENGPLVATQFHPEKSGDAGLQVLQNWLKGLK